MFGWPMSLIWTLKTKLLSIKSQIIVQDLNYEENEGAVYQDWGPSLSQRKGGGSWWGAFVQLVIVHSCGQVKTKQSSAIVSMDHVGACYGLNQVGHRQL